MSDNLRDDQLQFEITRRSGNDRYWIDLKKMVQTNANKKRGGRARRLRQVQLRVIFSKDGWAGKQDDASTAHWQVRLDSGWDMMADNLNSDLSRFVEKNGNAGVVTLKHHWTNP